MGVTRSPLWAPDIYMHAVLGMDIYYMASSTSRQDGPILPARDCTFCFRKKKKKIRPGPSGGRKVFFGKIFSTTVKEFSVISLSG